ncbi:MAG: hypothetical protein AB1657_04360 [Candidatus Micrarchaeota archaeon]
MRDTTALPAGTERNLALLENVAEYDGYTNDALAAAKGLVKRLPEGSAFDASSARNLLDIATNWYVVEYTGNKGYPCTAAVIGLAKDLCLDLPPGTRLTGNSARDLLVRAEEWAGSEKKLMRLLRKAAGRDTRFTEDDILRARGISFCSGSIPADEAGALGLLSKAAQPHPKGMAAPRSPVSSSRLPVPASTPVSSASPASVSSMATRPVTAPAIPPQPPAPQPAPPKVVVSPEAGIPNATERFIRRLAKKNGFTAREAASALALCAKYNWFPKPPAKALGMHVTHGRKERREALESEALDLLMQARHGYEYVRMLGGRGVPAGPLRTPVITTVAGRHSSSGKRIVSEEVLAEMRAEHSFLSNPSSYVYGSGKSGGFPRRVYMRAAERLSGKADIGSGDAVPVKLPSMHPDEYSRHVLEETRQMLIHESESTTVMPRPPVLTEEQKIQNHVLVGKAGDKGGFPMKAWIAAQNAAEAKGTILQDEEAASGYLAAAKEYLLKEEDAAKLISKAAEGSGYTDEEADAAIRLSGTHFVIPSDLDSAGDILLQARFKLQGSSGEYIWMIAEEGGYSYSVAFEAERRYLASGILLTRPQVLASLKEEKEFQSDVRSFVRDSCRVFLANAEILGPDAVGGLNDSMDSLAAGLEQAIRQKAGAIVPPELLRLPREEQVRRLVADERYLGWYDSGSTEEAAEGAQQLPVPGSPLPETGSGKPETDKAAEDLVKAAALAYVIKMGEAARRLHILEIEQADPELAQLLQKAWKAAFGAEPEDNAYTMLAEGPRTMGGVRVGRSGLLNIFQGEKLRRTAEGFVETLGKSVGGMRKKEPAPAALAEKEAELEGWNAVLAMPERLAALMRAVGKEWKPPADNYAAMAAEEALRRVRAGEASVKTPEEADKLFTVCRAEIRTKRQIDNRVQRGFIPEDVGKKALAILLSERKQFSGIDEETAFFSGLCIDAGHPYPAKLHIYLLCGNGSIAPELMHAALDKINSERIGLPSGPAVLEFLKVVERELEAAKESEARPTVPAAPPANGSGPRVHAVEIAAPIGLAATIAAGSEGDSGLLKPLPPPYPAPQLPVSGSRLPETPEVPTPPAEAPRAATAAAPTEPVHGSRLPVSGSGPVSSAAPESLAMAEALRGRTVAGHAVPPAGGSAVSGFLSPVSSSETESGKPGAKKLHLEIVPHAPDASESGEFQRVIDLTAGKPPVSGSQEMADAARGGTAVGMPAAQPATSSPLPVPGSHSTVSTPQPVADVPSAHPTMKGPAPAPDVGPALLGPDGKLLPPDKWRTFQRRAPTPEEIAAALAGEKAEAQAAGAPQPTADAKPETGNGRPNQTSRAEVGPGGRGFGLPETPSQPPAPVREEDVLGEEPAAPAAEGQPAPETPGATSHVPAAEPEPPAPVPQTAEAHADGIPLEARPTSLYPPPQGLVGKSGPENAGPTVYSPPAPELVASSRESGREVARLVKLLHRAKDSDARLAALQRLADINDPAALNGLAGALDYPDVAMGVCSMLISRGDGAVIRAVSEEFGSCTREGKLNAVSVLREIGTQEALAALSPVLLDTEPAVSAEAARVLLAAHGADGTDTHKYFRNLDFNRSLALLKEAVLDSDGSELSEAAGVSAATLLSEFAVRYPEDVYPVLCSATAGGNAEVRKLAVSSIHSGGLRLLPSIYAGREDGENLRTISVLGQMGTEEACDVLAPMLTHDSQQVAEGAASRLILLGGKGLDTRRYFLAMDFSRAGPLLGELLAHNEDVNVRRGAAGLLAELAPGHRDAYPLLASAIAEGDTEASHTIMQALHEGSFDALRHLEDTLLDPGSPEVAVERAAELFLSAKGDDADVHYAYSRLLEAASGNSRAMEIMEAEADFGRVCAVLGDYNAPFAARKSAAALVGGQAAGTSVPLLLNAYQQQPELRESVASLLAAMEPAGMLAVALSESRTLGRVHDPLISQLVMEMAEKGSNPVAHLASYAEAESSKGTLTAEECRFMISLAMEAGFADDDANRILASSLPVLKGMDDEQLVAAARFARKIGKGAVPVILRYAEAAAEGLGADGAHLLSIVVEDIGAKEGVEFLKHALPEAVRMNPAQLEKLQDLAIKLDAAHGEAILLEYAERKSREGALTPKEALALSGLASAFGGLLESGRCAALAGHMLPLIKDMDAADVAAMQDFASLPVFAEGATKHAGRFLADREKEGIAPKEAAAIAVLLARINSDASYRLLSGLVSGKSLGDEAVRTGRRVEEALSAAYGKGEVRPCLMRAAFDRGELSDLGLVAFKIFREQKDCGADLIKACVKAHLFGDVEAADNADRLREARTILVRNGDLAVGQLSDIVLSVDFSRYPPEYRRNALVTIGELAGYARKKKGHRQSEATEKKARECLLNAIGMKELSEGVVAMVLSEMRNINLLDSVAAVLSTEGGEKLAARVYNVLRLMGRGAQEQIGAMLRSGDENKAVQAAELFTRVLQSGRETPKELSVLPEFRENTRLLAGLLRHRNGMVSTCAEDALKAAGPYVPLDELERMVRLRVHPQDLLPLDLEIASRKTAAQLMAAAGGPAAEHFAAIIGDSRMLPEVISEVLGVAAGSPAIGEKLLEPMALRGGQGDLEEKYEALNFAAELDSPFSALLCAVQCGKDVGVPMSAAFSGSPPAEWQKLLLKWAAVKAVVYRGEASAASQLIASGMFTAAEIGELMRDAVDKRLADERMMARDRRELPAYYAGYFGPELRGRIAASMNAPRPAPSPGLPLPKRFRGLVQGPPPVPRGARKLHH